MAKRYSGVLRLVADDGFEGYETLGRTMMAVQDSLTHNKKSKHYKVIRELPDGVSIQMVNDRGGNRTLIIEGSSGCIPVIMDKPGIMLMVNPILEGGSNIWWWDNEKEKFVPYESRWALDEQYIFNSLDWVYQEGKATQPPDVRVTDENCFKYTDLYVPVGSNAPFPNSTMNESLPVGIACQQAECAYDWRVYTQTDRYYTLNTTWHYYQPLLADMYSNYKLEYFYEGANDYDMIGSTMIKKNGSRNWLIRLLIPFESNATYGRFLSQMKCLVEAVEVKRKSGEVVDRTRRIAGSFTIDLASFSDGRDVARYNDVKGLRLHYQGLAHRASWSTGDYEDKKRPGQLGHTAKGAWIVKQMVYDYANNHSLDFGLRGGRGAVIRVYETTIKWDKENGVFDISNREVEAESTCIGRIKPVEVSNNVTHTINRNYFANSYSQLYEDLYWASPPDCTAEIPSSTYIEKSWSSVNSTRTETKDFGFEDFTRDYTLAVGYVDGVLNPLKVRLKNIGKRVHTIYKHHEQELGYDCSTLICNQQSTGIVKKTETNEDTYPGISCEIYDKFDVIFDAPIYSENKYINNILHVRTYVTDDNQGHYEDDQENIYGEDDQFYNNIEFLKADPQNRFYAVRLFYGKVQNRTEVFYDADTSGSSKTSELVRIFEWVKRVKFIVSGKEAYEYLEEEGSFDESVDIPADSLPIDYNMDLSNFSVEYSTTVESESCERQNEIIDTEIPGCAIQHQFFECGNFTSSTDTGTDTSTSTYSEAIVRNPMASSGVDKYGKLKAGKLYIVGYPEEATSLVDREYYHYIDEFGFLDNAQFISYDGDLGARTHASKGGQLKDKKTYVSSDIKNYVFSINGDWAVVLNKYVGNTNYSGIGTLVEFRDTFAARSSDYETVLIINGKEYKFDKIDALSELGITDFAKLKSDYEELPELVVYNGTDTDILLYPHSITGF